MIINHLKELLDRDDRPLLWLAQETGIGYQRLTRHYHNRAIMMQYNTLEKVCRALKCTPGDLLEVRDEGKDGKESVKARRRIAK